MFSLLHGRSISATTHVLPLIFAWQVAFAQDVTIRWKGEVRVRGEVDGRDFRSSTPANTYVLLRARFGAEIQPTENTQVVLQLQDARVFGEEKAGSSFSTIANTKNLDLRLAYVTIDDLVIPGLNASVGRMALSYGGERLIGTVDWNNIGRVFDGALLRYQWSSQSIDLFVANTGETTVPPSVTTRTAVAGVRDSGETVSGINWTLRTEDKRQFDIYLFHQWNRNQSVRGHDDVSRFTGGTYVKGSIDELDYEAEFAYQIGTLSRMDIGAFLLSGSFRYILGQSALTSIGVGYDYLSGTALGSTDYQSFDPSFHTGHKFYGFMDYFVNIPANTNSRGLQDFFLEGVVRPSETTSILLRGHYFALAEPWSGARDLGGEIDLVGAVNYDTNVSFEAGASAFFPAFVMRAWFNGDDVAMWGYFTTRVWF